jgi:PKD repeat protein
MAMGKMVNLFVTVISIALLAALIPNGFPPVNAADEYTLTLKILEESNRSPIHNANVSIYGPVYQSKLSDINGTVVFILPAGNYSVVTSAPGYTVISSQFVLLDTDKYITLLFSSTRAFFVYSPAIVQVKKPVFFDASPSNSSGIITSYNWDFGDNATGTNRTITHTFLKTGEYLVALTVISTVGQATYTQTIVVNSTNDNNIWFLLFLLPLLLLLLLFRRRRYYVVIQVRVPPDRKCLHCPGDNTKCDDCKLTPC